MPRAKKEIVHKRVGKSGGLAADGRTYFIGPGAQPKLTNKWDNVSCKMCLAKRPGAKAEPKSRRRK